MKQFNTNWQLSAWIRDNVEPLLTLRPLREYRDKAIGSMATSGSYKIRFGTLWLVVEDNGHYHDFPNGERKWSLRSVNGLDAYWHLAISKGTGKVYLTEQSSLAECAVECVEDWIETPFTLNKN